MDEFNYNTRFGIYIDAEPGYGAPYTDPLVRKVPGYGNEIDSIIYAWPNQWEGRYKYWTGAGFSDSAPTAMFQHTENGGRTLEWKYEGDFGPSFAWYAAAFGTILNKIAYDYVATPIPNAVWLLGSGLLGLIGLARRKRGKK